MINTISSGFASSSARNPGVIPHPVSVEACLAALNVSSSFDDMWEPPTPDDWRRALRTIALHVVREVFRSGVDRRLLQEIGPLLTWH